MALIEKAYFAAREASWMTPRRAKAYCWIFAVLNLGLALGWVSLSAGGIDPGGKPLGTDFTSFWAASKLALGSHPELAYDNPSHFAAQRAIFDGADWGHAAFLYPPVFLLYCLPLALLPYMGALFVWLGLTGFACWCVVRQFLERHASLLLLIAYPASLQNLGHGQNAFLSTALFGGGILALNKRPVLAGACFGALIFKPHLGLLVPIFLIASGRWRAFVSAGCTSLALAAVSWVVLGDETWRAFLGNAGLAQAILEQNLVGYEKMQSVFAGLRLLQASTPFSYLAQTLTGAGAAALLILLCRRPADNAAQGPALIVATLLASPYLLDYDLMLLAIPLAWMLAEGRRTGFLPWEKLGLMAAFLLPLISRTLAGHLAVPLGPPVIAFLFVLVLRRGGLPLGRRISAPARTFF